MTEPRIAVGNSSHVKLVILLNVCQLWKLYKTTYLAARLQVPMAEPLIAVGKSSAV